MSQDDYLVIQALIILTLVTIGIQWLAVKFTHWSVALVISALISFIVSFLYVSLSDANPNGSNYNSGSSAEIITSTILVLSIFLIAFCIFCYLGKIQIPKEAYITSLGLTALMVTGFFTSRFIVEQSEISLYDKDHRVCKIEIKNETGLPPFVESFSFRNTSNASSNQIELKSNSDENAMLRQYDWEYNYIPRFTNEIRFRTAYTNEKGNRFFQEFPFDFSPFENTEEPRSKEEAILFIKIVLKNNRKIDLYIENRFIKQYVLSDE